MWTGETLETTYTLLKPAPLIAVVLAAIATGAAVLATLVSVISDELTHPYPNAVRSTTLVRSSSKWFRDHDYVYAVTVNSSILQSRYNTYNIYEKR